MRTATKSTGMNLTQGRAVPDNGLPLQIPPVLGPTSAISRGLDGGAAGRGEGDGMALGRAT